MVHRSIFFPDFVFSTTKSIRIIWCNHFILVST